MQLSYSAEKVTTTVTDIILCFTPKLEGLKDKHLQAVDRAVKGGLRHMIEAKEFSGKNGEMAVFFRPEGYRAVKLAVVGLGEADKVDAEAFRKALGKVSRDRAIKHARTMAIHVGAHAEAGYAQAMMEGYLLGAYKNTEYKSKSDDENGGGPKKVVFVVDQKQAVTAVRGGVERGRIIAEGQMLARRLAETPGNDLTPTLYAKEARRLAKQHGLKCKVLDEKAIVKERMGALLSVSRGSDEPPRFIILEYMKGKTGEKPVVLVGKGVTFDSGGISLKPGQNMHEMKQDMAGSAAVLAAMVTAARLKTKLNLVGLIPSVENMPSGKATRPGDIVAARNGKTIEIINTDAEGRLILADALDYANKYKPQAVIDIATLTGAALFILGYYGAPIMGNDEQLLNRINDAGDETGERVWPLPIWDEMRDLMKSSIADLVNSGGRPSGTICAAAFLENFIGEWPWAHIDIAYVDLEPKGTAYTPAGATGYGVRLLTHILENWKKL